MGNDIGAMQNYQQSVLDAIDTVVQRRINGLKLDKTVVAIIDKNVGSLNGYPLYQVKYEGGTFVATARDSSESYMRNTAVYVMIPQSDFSKEKFIIGKASSMSANSAESASISAAINNYVKLGPNLIQSSDTFGLRSYHDPREEETDPNSLLHRARYLYNVADSEGSSNNIQINQDTFKKYAENASNILFRADFRTLLNVVQQRSANGRYGLALTLTFTNPNAGYGETQGEILDNLGGSIIGKTPKMTTPNTAEEKSYSVDITTNTQKETSGWINDNVNIDNISLKDWDKNLQMFFNAKDITEDTVGYWKRDNTGLFDCYSQYIQQIYKTFSVNSPASKTSLTDNLVNAYVNLLVELKKASSLSEIKRIYNNWRTFSIGDLSDVDEIIYLTSDSMLGNPFTFNNWNTQYVIPSQVYDFSRFKCIKNIVFFKDGFNQDSEKEQIWPPSDAPKNGGKGWDICCQNIQLFLLKELDSEYQGLSLKVECSDGYDGILKTLSPNEKTSFNAHVYRNQIEEITGNANIQYVWLKQNSQVINASHADYYHYAGVGWKRLRNTNRYFFQTTGNENWAYKNNYKCIALYQSGNETIPLSTNFIVYNDAVSTKIRLESDLGTSFTFGEGSPTITCKIQEAPLSGKTGVEAENYQELSYNEDNPLYRYQWSIIDSANDSVLFLEEAIAQNTSNILKDNVLSNIKMWYLDSNQQLKETIDSTKASRIKYPVSLSSTGFTVECSIQKNFSFNEATNASHYYDVGSDSIEISNLKMASSTGYRIVIENGDQVFQYDVYGNAPTETKFKDPLEIKPLRAKVVSCNGLEFSGENVDIEWIFNLEDSLIVPPEKLVLNPATQQEQLVKGAECTFGIEKLYNPNAQNNQISCHAHFNNIDIYQDTNFYFGKVGSNGSNGTDVVSKISYQGLDNFFVLHEQPLTLRVFTDMNEDGEDIKKGALNVPNIVNNLEDTVELIPNPIDVHLYQKGEEIDSINFSQGYPRWSLAGNDDGKYFNVSGNEITWDPNYNNDNRHPLLQNFKSEVVIKDSKQSYYSFFSLPIIEYEKDVAENEKISLEPLSIDKSKYLNDVVYNSDGRNPIFNHNQGLKLINLPADSVITWEARGGLNGLTSERTNIVQEYLETEPDFSIGFEKDTKETFTRVFTQRESSSDEVHRKAVYEKEREEAQKNYYTTENIVDDQGNETTKNIEGPLYNLYLIEYEKDKEKALVEFKQKKLRELQQEAKLKFIKERVSQTEEDDYWTEKQIRNGQREDMPLEDCFWFSQNVSLWWDSEATVDLETVDLETAIDPEQPSVDGKYYVKIEEEGSAPVYKPILIWDESRYQITEDDKENEWYDQIYYKSDNNVYKSIEVKKEKNYFYKTIYKKVDSPLNVEEYFNSVYPAYQEEKTPDIQVIKDDITEAMIYILPNDTYDGYATNNRVEAKIYIPVLNSNGQTEMKLYATIYAPINMTLDTFGLDSINAWDGNQITIDDERGAILAPQIGAGEKDSNNRFTGILMGKTNTYTGQSDGENQTGLFGYSYGIQSIFLDAKTGNADFGLPNGNSIQLDSKGNYIGLKNDDYNEGRIELRPGGVSKIGGWRLGHRSLYYTKSGEIGPRYNNDYVPNWKTGKIEYISSEPYSKHHEKDIDYRDSGILLHSGDDPYISIKGRQLTEDDIDPADLGNYIRPEDSLEIQLDPKAPTLFTVFRHNGSNWMERKRNSDNSISSDIKYEEGTRTYLAGINGKGEFVANTVSNIIEDNNSDVYTTQFSVNSFRAFDDLIDNNGIEIPNHTGLRIKLGPHILGQMFVSNNGFKADGSEKSTLFITSGLTSEYGEYSRPLSLHGAQIDLFAKDASNTKRFYSKTDSHISLKTNEFNLNLGEEGESTSLNLYRNIGSTNNLMTVGDLKINAGVQQEGPSEEYIYYEGGGKINKKNNPRIYLRFKNNEDQDTYTYIIDKSWTSGAYYSKIGPTDSEFFVAESNYPICYKVKGIDYYCTEDDFYDEYYKVENLPDTVDLDYEYLSETYLKTNRYTKNGKKYDLLGTDTLYEPGQYVGIMKKEELIDLNQSYYYIKKANIDTGKLYALYNDKYVYIEDTSIYYIKKGNNYVKGNNINLEIKIKGPNNKYYSEDQVDTNNSYYCFTYENIDTYIMSDILDFRYVKADDIAYYDEDNNIIETFDGGYRYYNDETDNTLGLSNIYFFYNDNYYPLSSIKSVEDNFIKYSLIIDDDDSDTYLETNSLETQYFVNDDLVDKSEYDALMDNIYYQAKDASGIAFYILQNDYLPDRFIYYHLLNNTWINNSDYIAQTDLNLNSLYSYVTTSKTYEQNDEEGIYYQTFIIDPEKGTYEYIPITQSSTTGAYININNKYISNDLYQYTQAGPWHLKNNLSLDTQSDDENEDKRYVYFLNNEKFIVYKLDSLTKYYAVRDIHNNWYYVLADFLESYDGETFIFDGTGYKEIIKSSQEPEEPKSLISNKHYEIYAGSYLNKITTNITNNYYASLKCDQEGIDFYNSTGPISMFSDDNYFKLKVKSGGEISFGDKSTTFNDEPILSKFVKDDFDNGLSLTNTWLRLKSNMYMQVESPDKISMISSTQGNGPVYTSQNPQIVLRAGSEESIVPGAVTAATGTAAELILNSSNNSWKSEEIKGKPLEQKGAWPVFAVRTRYSKIGIYPEIYTGKKGLDLYRENFYIEMPQYNSMGLSISGLLPGYTALGLNVQKGALFGGKVTTKTGFKGDGKEITNTCGGKTAIPTKANGKKYSTDDHSFKITVPSIIVKDGRPIIGSKEIEIGGYTSIPASQVSYGNSNVASELAALNKKINNLSNTFATKEYVNNKIKSHSHDFKYTTFTFKDKDGGSHTAVSRMSDSVGDSSITIT